MPSSRLLCMALVAAGTLTSAVTLAGTPVQPESRPSSAGESPRLSDLPISRAKKGDWEPEDPAEQRPQTMPPPRPVLRGSSQWVERGPTPTVNGQINVPPDNRVSGAVQGLAAHPSNANILYAGTTNGGIWKTTNATVPNPTWVPQTDELPSQSIGAIAFDPLDGTRNTLIAGIGRTSNFARRGDDELGIYYTTNGGSTWTLRGSPTLVGQRIIAVAARGSVLLAGSSNGGLFRSTNTGTNWTLVSGTGGLPSGNIGDLAADPSNNSRFYISVLGASPQVLRSTDNGASWTSVTAGLSGLSSSTGNIRIAVGPTGAVFLAVVNSGQLAGVWRSSNQGTNWTAMDVPPIHPGGQGTLNTAIAVDPTDSNIVYLAGDRITVSPFTGNVVRCSAALTAGSQCTSIVDGNAGNTTPHADSRNMVFDASGVLLESDDGGIYRRSQPRSSAGTWSSVNGNLAVMEVHDLDHDKVANILVIGTQDNGTHMQQTPAGTVWTRILGGDGGDIAIDDVSLGTAGAFRFISSQNLGSFRRVQYNAANTAVGTTGMPGLPAGQPQFVTPLETNPAASNRLLVGGLTRLYESTNANAGSPTLTDIGGPGANRNAMVYGSNANPDAGYVGKNAQVWRRAPGGFVATTALPAGAATITDVTMDPDNPNLVYAVDDNQVFRSSNAGSTWTDVTGNLASISSLDFRTIEFIPAAPGDLVAIGTRSGVFVQSAAGGNWSLLAGGMPDVLVFDLRYVQEQGTLYAGTLGRGVWSYTFPGMDTLFANGFENP